MQPVEADQIPEASPEPTDQNAHLNLPASEMRQEAYKPVPPRREKRVQVDPAARAKRQAAAEERREEKRRKQRAEIERGKREGGLPLLEMVVSVEWNGTRYELSRPEELRWLSDRRQRQLILDVLSLAALSGNIQAARAWLDEYRWGVEMKKGKPVARMSGGALAIPVMVLDDLSASARTVEMPRTKPGQVGSLRGVRCLPAPTDNGRATGQPAEAQGLTLPASDNGYYVNSSRGGDGQR